METKPHQSNSLQRNPDNPPPSPLPPRPSPEANDNLSQALPAQQQNLKRPSESNQVSVPTGIPPLPNSSNNSGRKRRSKKSKSAQQTDMSPQPQFSPQISQSQLLLQQDLLRQMQQTLELQQQWRQPVLPQPQQQRSPQMMQRCMRQSNMQRDQGLSYSNFLTEVMHYQWAKPQNNSIGFWRQYVSKYYDPKAKERRCLSMCNDNIGISSSDDTWHCSLCGWKPGRGFEVSFEELPQRLKLKFDRMDGERWCVGMAQEYRSVPGVTILLYPKATQRSICGQHSIVYEGLLRIAITDQLKIFSWEFCVSRREAYVSFPPLPFRGENWLGIGEISRRPEAKNVADENPEEGLQRNNIRAQDARLQTVKNTGFLTFQTENNLDFSENCPYPKGVKACDNMEGSMEFSTQKKLEPMGLQNSSRPCPGSGLQRQEMMAKHQGNTQGQQINHITMNSTRAIHPGPNIHDISSHYRIIGGQNANRMSGKAVSIGVDNIQTAASPVDSTETCLIGNPAETCLTRNPAANLPTPRAEEQLIRHSTMNNPQATRTGRSSHKNNEHHMIIGGQNANGIPGNGVAGGVRITQTAATPPVEPGETGLIPNPAMALQVHEMPVMGHPASAQRPLTNDNTMNSPTIIHDYHIFIDQQNGFEILEDCIFDGVGITQATALADEDIETYLIDNPAAQFHTQEMQVMNHQGSVQGQLTNHNTMNYKTMYPDPSNNVKNGYHIIIGMQNEDRTVENKTTAELGSPLTDADY